MRQLKKVVHALCFSIGFISALPVHADTTVNPESVIDPIIQRLMANRQIPGVAVALYYNGQSYFYNYGVANEETGQPVDEHTIFEIGSITKAFTATLLAEEVNAGVMSLTDPVVKYLPSSVAAQNGAINQVTLLELATHTSSLPDVPPDLTLRARPDFDEDDLMNYIASWQPDFPVGSRFQYSNIGYGVLGDALEGASHQSYQQLLQTNILDPLNMTDTTLNTAADPTRYAQGYNLRGLPAMRWPVNAWPAAGALRSTSSDMLSFLEANLGVSNGTPNPTLLQAMQFAQQGRYTTPRFKQGLAWMRFSQRCTPLVAKDGGTVGFHTMIEMAPAYKIGIVILTNRIEMGEELQRPASRILIQLAGCNKNASA